MPVFHTKTIESILEPVAQQVNSKILKFNNFCINLILKKGFQISNFTRGI